MKSKKIVLLQLLVAFVLICTTVYATVNSTLNLSASSTNVKAGDTVNVTLKLAGVSDETIKYIEGYINYDKNVLEQVTVNDIVSTDNKVQIGNESLAVEDFTNVDNINAIADTTSYLGFNGSPVSNNDVKIVIGFKNGVTSDTDLFTLKFKVKQNVSTGTVANAIRYEAFTITNDDSRSDSITKNITLTVTGTQNPDTNTTNEPVNNPTNNPVNNPTNNPTNNPVNNATNNVGNNTTNQPTNNTVNNTTNKVNNTTNKVNNTTNNTVNNTTNKVNNTTNNTTNKTVNGTNKTNTNDNTAKGVLPATGSELVILPFVCVIALAIVSYKKYQEYKNI